MLPSFFKIQKFSLVNINMISFDWIHAVYGYLPQVDFFDCGDG